MDIKHTHDGPKIPSSWRENFDGAEALIVLLCGLVVCIVGSALVIGFR